VPMNVADMPDDKESWTEQLHVQLSTEGGEYNCVLGVDASHSCNALAAPATRRAGGAASVASVRVAGVWRCARNAHSPAGV